MRLMMILGLALLLSAKVDAEQFEFLPPETEGTYSIGIYDKSGALVRTLVKEGNEDSFKIGLNGFILKWDEKLEDGSPAPAGKYKAKGYVIPKLKVVALEEATSTAPVMPIVSAPFESVDLIGMEAKGPFVIGKTMGGVRIYWREDWTLQLPALGEGEIPVSANWWNGALEIKTGNASFRLALDMPEPTWVQLDGESTATEPTRGPEDKLGKPDVSCAGADGTTWLVEIDEDGAWELRQFAADGEFLRQMPGGTGSKILSIAASSDDKQLVMLRKEKDGSINLIKLTEKEKADDSDEVAEFSEKIIPMVAASAPGSSEIRLAKNTLEPGVVPRMKVQVEVDEEGVFLSTSEGLFLRRLIESKGIQSAKVEVREGSLLLSVTDSLGKTNVYTVSGLRKAMGFEPGDLEVR